MLTSLDNLRLLSSPQAASNKRKKRFFGDQPRPQRYVGCAQHTLPSPPRPAKGRPPLGTLLQKNAFYVVDANDEKKFLCLLPFGKTGAIVGLAKFRNFHPVKEQSKNMRCSTCGAG